MANNIDLTISALECPLGTFQCSGRLIFRKEYTVLFSPKRTTSRFASLTLRTPHRPIVSLCFSGRLIFRLRTGTFFQKVPVFRMAYSAPTAHCAVSSETLMLQPLRGLRTPHRPIVSLCFSPKRTTSRFASLTLRLRTETFFQKVPVFCMAYSAPTAHCAVSSETLMLQPLRGLRTPHRPIVSLCFSGRLIFRLRAETFFQKVPVFRMAYSAPTAHRAVSSETLMLQVRFAHPPNPAPSSRFFVLF